MALLKSFFLAAILALFAINGHSQINPQDSAIFAPILNFHYSYQFPGGDLSRRFGNNHNVGASFVIKTRSNFVFGVEGSFLFGDNVKEDPIAEFRVDGGEIISEGGTYANVLLMQRGFALNARVGKIFSVLSPNPNSGPYVYVTAGYMQHNIRYQVDRNTVPFLRDEYVGGYDRLTSGFALSQFIGYRYFSNNRLVNFYIGYEFTQGFTQGRRPYNFDERATDNSSRSDLLQGVKLGWSIPLYKKTPREFYYN